jgi:hypothetical protein
MGCWYLSPWENRMAGKNKTNNSGITTPDLMFIIYKIKSPKSIYYPEFQYNAPK